MSADGTHVTAAHLDYVRAHTIPEDDVLRDLVEAAAAAGLPRIRIAPEQGAFLHVALRAIGAREVVEVGTLGGYSAVWMARAVGPQGRVRTIEVDPERANFTETRIAASDVAGRVEVHRGDAREVLPGFADDSADAAFIDADKSGYATYFEHCRRIVRPGGLLLVDNAFAFGNLPPADADTSFEDPDVRAIAELNDRLAGRDDYPGLILPIGDGLWYGINERPSGPPRSRPASSR